MGLWKFSFCYHQTKDVIKSMRKKKLFLSVLKVDVVVMQLLLFKRSQGFKLVYSVFFICMGTPKFLVHSKSAQRNIRTTRSVRLTSLPWWLERSLQLSTFTIPFLHLSKLDSLCLTNKILICGSKHFLNFFHQIQKEAT